MGTKVKPLHADDVNEIRKTTIPDEVFEVFNTSIVAALDGRQAVLPLDMIVTRIMQRLDVPREKVFSSGWLNVEGIYRNCGWDVVFEKADLGSEGSSYIFRKT